MTAFNPSPHLKHYGWLLLILLAAVFLRFYHLYSVPPGITHDEADHGITAWSIVTENVREIYFTIGYGREPLYDYLTASLMTFLGPTYLAGRIISVFFSLILIAAMFTWVRRAFNESTALLTAAGLAVGFWPLMSGRQALRSTLLPTLFVMAVLFFWFGLEKVNRDDTPQIGTSYRQYLLFIVAGLFLGLTFYTYIPARSLWIIFPALLFYLFFAWKSLFRRAFWLTGLMLLIMFIVAAPLIVYLRNNPTSEVRIQQLAVPLAAAASGNFSSLNSNVQQSMGLFFAEGDGAWRYNLAGRPWLGPVMGLLFLVGVVLSFWRAFFQRAKAQLPRGRRYAPASFLALTWLGAGFLPVLITGSDLAMTQAIGMQPILYLFPALTLAAVGQVTVSGRPLSARPWVVVGLLLLFLGTAIVTYRDYFITWANSPDVRVQYESTLSAALEYLDEHGEGSAVISTITPDRYHSPAVAQMLLRNDAVDLSWFDARNSLLLSDTGISQIIIPGFTPLSPALESYFSTAELAETVPLRETDLDRPLSIYVVDGQKMLADWETQLLPANAQFADTISLLGYELQPSTAVAGETMQLVTLWRANRPLDNAVLFAHVLGSDRVPLAQKDQLGVPGYAWQPGDFFLQLHDIALPPQLTPGHYPVAVGVYTQHDGARLPLIGTSGEADLFYLTDIEISP